MDDTSLNKKNNILCIHQGAEFYGSDKVFYNSVITLNRIYDVYVILPQDGILKSNFEIAGIKVTVLRLFILRRSLLKLNKIPFGVKSLITDIINLKEIIYNKNIDIIYSNTIAVISGAITAKILNKKHYWHIHEIIEKPKILSIVIRFIINKLSDKIIVVSNAVKNFVLYNNMENSFKIKLLYNGFEWGDYLKSYNNSSDYIKKLGIRSNNIIITCVGRLHFWKGQDLLLKSFNLLSQSNSNIKLLLIGDVFPGYEYIREKLIHFVEEKSLSEKVIFLGFRLDIPNLMHISDIIVIPSIQPDPFPTTVLEAMASGKAVIGAKIGGIPEMIRHGKSGLLFTPNDENDLSNKIQQLLDDPLKRKQLGIEARKEVLDKFSLVNYASNLLIAFQE